jgi:ABC-type transport system involved in multi-copper enzyme maturation permease subunit
MIEGARKQIFHVLMLFALFLIAVSTMLAVFDHNVQIKIVTDLCSVAIMLSSGIIAITLNSSGTTQEVESKTIYPVLAKPVSRWQFVVGKYLGTLGTVTIGMLIMMAAFAAILQCTQGSINAKIFLVMPYLLLEAAILGAVSQFFSTFSSPPLAWFMTIVIFLIANFKFGLSSYLNAPTHDVVSRFAGLVLYQALPNLECFDFKDSLVHGLTVPTGYLISTAVYGIVYTCCVLSISSAIFARKEL